MANHLGQQRSILSHILLSNWPLGKNTKAHIASTLASNFIQPLGSITTSIPTTVWVKERKVKLTRLMLKKKRTKWKMIKAYEQKKEGEKDTRPISDS